MQRPYSPRPGSDYPRRSLDRLLILVGNDDGSDDPGRDHNHQTAKNDRAPFDADPMTLPAVAAAIDLSPQSRENEALPELPAAPLDVIRLTVGALHVEAAAAFPSR